MIRAATLIIGLSQVLIIGTSLIVLFGEFKLDFLLSSILTSIFFSGFVFLNEYVLWSYVFVYWVTSQNIEIIYFNMTVVYSDLP